MKKPTSGDSDQRRHDTRVSRRQSGLPPEDEDAGTEGQQEPQEQQPRVRKETGSADAEP